MRPQRPRSRARAGGLALAVTAMLAAAPTAVMAAAPGGPALADPAPVLGAQRATAVPGSYIVVFENHARDAVVGEAVADATRRGGRVVHEYGAALRGFAGRLPEPAVEALRHNPHVAYIEADQQVRSGGTQSGATWGLDRTDQRTLPLNGSYSYDRTGAGVTAYVVDTGIRPSHTEFSGRLADGYTAIDDGRGTADCNGHGTHVAGTVGGTTYGVAKQVTLVPVRVLDCAGSGTTSGVIAGVDWVTSHHTGTSPAVANLSLGGAASSALDSAVASAIADGVTYVVAAGNENVDACTSSPARVGAALTVGSTTRSDARSGFSNYGTCLDLFAPGSEVASAWHTGDTATSTLSGTSMATPHAAGAAAAYLEANPAATPAAVTNALLAAATTGVVTGAGSGSPNRLLHQPPAATATPAPAPAPAANLLLNPGFESGVTAWQGSSGVVTSASGVPARTGSWKAWLNGYGTARTETLAQSVAIPAATKATLSFHLYVTSKETTTTRAYDRLAVQVVSGGTTTTLRTFSNLHKGPSYVQRSFDVTAFAGRTVTVRLTGTENSSRATSFVVDDTSLTTG